MVQYLRIEDRQNSLSFIFCYCKHCTKSKFCAKRDRSKIIEPISESYLQICFHSYHIWLLSLFINDSLTNIITLLFITCNNVSLVPDIYF